MNTWTDRPLFGPYGTSALTDADQLTEYGANAVWFHGFNPEAFEICARHGIAPCVEFKTFRANLDERPELTPIGIDGKPIRYGRLIQGVCLSNEAFLQETEQALLAGLDRFAPRGIWLDYLTYAGWFETPAPDLQQSCFCPACIAEFCQATDIDATSPDEILGHYAKQWTQHKCERIAHFGAHYASLIRQRLPDCLVGAYMCPWTPNEFGGALRSIFAQDYELLAPAIDVFTPLIYAEKSGREATWGRDFLDRAPDFVPAGRKVQLILDVLDFPASLLAITDAPSPSWGVQIFAGAEIFCDTASAQIFAQAVQEIEQRIQAS